MSWKNTIKKNEDRPRWGSNDWKPDKAAEREYEDNIMELLYKLSAQLEYYFQSSGKEFDDKRIMQVLEDIGEEKAQAAHEYRYDL